jgi:hypothetical protein
VIAFDPEVQREHRRTLIIVRSDFMTAPLIIPLVVNSVIQAPAQWPGGQGVLAAAASAYNAATLTLQFRGPDGATYISTATTLTANGLSAVFTLPLGIIQVIVTGGAPTALYCNAQAIPVNLN